MIYDENHEIEKDITNEAVIAWAVFAVSLVGLLLIVLTITE